ncbi:YceD family protein [Heyndrickxia sp. NPDC080065]|uniref:YceD family protein n=1 Tax=Heyndrickxia sp. NPDC080065 TaxID=3390568 RepID=UPI003CFC04CF
MISLKWSTIQLLKYRGKSIDINEIVDISENLKKRDPQIRGVSQIHVAGSADVTSEKVTFHLHVTGSLVLPCSRTLVDVDFPIDVKSTEIFLLNPHTSFDENEDDEIHRPTDDIVDLEPVIIELLLLEIPMQVFSETAKDDKQLPSGNEWEVITEEQVKQDVENKEKQVDPRLAGLAKFFDEQS